MADIVRCQVGSAMRLYRIWAECERCRRVFAPVDTEQTCCPNCHPEGTVMPNEPQPVVIQAEPATVEPNQQKG